MWWVKFITKKSQAQTKHTLEHNKNLCSLQIASSQEDRLYSTNVCSRKGWLLTLAAGLTRKKTSRREILGFAVLGNTVWGWQKSMHVVQIPFLLFLATISLLGKNVETYSRISWLYICPIYTQSTYLWYIWPFLHWASKTALWWYYCSNCMNRSHKQAYYTTGVAHRITKTHKQRSYTCCIFTM